MPLPRPNVVFSTTTIIVLAIAWGFTRNFVFSDTTFPLTYVLPLLACVWSRQYWHLWLMATTFCILAITKVVTFHPAGAAVSSSDWGYLIGTLANVTIGAFVIYCILRMRDRKDEHILRIQEQNAELEAQAEELSQQNEEIRSQAEELAEQNEEIESQSEEMARQNDELVHSNERLANRESVLQGLLEASRNSVTLPVALNNLCKHAVSIIGPPATAVAILEKEEEQLRLRAHFIPPDFPEFPTTWPLTDSFAAIVFDENKTAYVSDLTKRPDIARPFGLSSPVRSVIAAPFHRGNGVAGLFVAT